MKKVWVVVANSTVAKIYRIENGKTLSLHHTLEHEEGHLHRGDILSDRKGRNSQKGYYGSDTMEDHTPLKVKEADHFGAQVGKFVEEGFKKQEFEHLHLIAKAPFLSHIKDHLSANVTKSIKSEVHKDLTLLTPKEIYEYLPPVP